MNIEIGPDKVNSRFENLVKYSIKNLRPVWGMIFISKPMAKPLGYTVYDNRKCSPMQILFNIHHNERNLRKKKKILKQISLYRMYLQKKHSQKGGSFFQQISFLQPWAHKISFFFQQVLVTMKELPKGAPLRSWWVGGKDWNLSAVPPRSDGERVVFFCDWTFQGSYFCMMFGWIILF